MARPLKKGLSYFPLDTDFLSNRKIQRLRLKHGSNGIATYIALLVEIYSNEGYYIRHTSNLLFDIGFNVQLSEAEVKEILDSCLKFELFDKKQLKTNKIYN